MTELAIVGITRFSVVNPHSFLSFETTFPENGQDRTVEYARRAVYSLERMHVRWLLFNAFTLPSMKAAARRYRNFYYVLLISPDLPLRWKARLYALQVYYDWLYVEVIAPTEANADAATRAVSRFARGRRSFCFRIDDDDAMCPAFVDVVTREASQCANGTVLSLNSGFYLQKLADNEFRLHERNYPGIAIGLGVFSGADKPVSIYALGKHTKIRNHTNVLDISGDPYWIRIMHSRSDSGKRAFTEEPLLSTASVQRTLRPVFAHLDFRKALSIMPATSDVQRPSVGKYLVET